MLYAAAVGCDSAPPDRSWMERLVGLFALGPFALSRLGTWITTRMYGKLVGEDAAGNRYYRSKRQPLWGRERRWVDYRGCAEASKIPPEWHAWLHHLSPAPLTEAANRKRWWQKPHLPNLTGTPLAYRPKGHDLEGGHRARTTSDYEPWTPA